jgi:hypothetical protein
MKTSVAAAIGRATLEILEDIAADHSIAVQTFYGHYTRHAAHIAVHVLAESLTPANNIAEVLRQLHLHDFLATL